MCARTINKRVCVQHCAPVTTTAFPQHRRASCMDPTKGTITFQDFALNFLWLQHTLESVLAKYEAVTAEGPNAGPPSSAKVTAAAGAVPLKLATSNGWHHTADVTAT